MNETIAIRIAVALERLAAAVERVAPVPAVNPDEWVDGLYAGLARMPVVTAKAAIKRAESDVDLRAVLAPYVDRGDSGTMSLGKRLAKLADNHVVAGGRMLVRCGDDRKAGAYRVRTSGTSSSQVLIEKLRTSL